MNKLLPLVMGAALAAILVACTPSASTPSTKQGPLKHVVCFKFKPTASPEQIQQVENDFRALQTKIPQIISFEYGTNVSPEKLNKGFTHCFVLSFASEPDRDVYLKHPDHEAFAKSLGPVLDEPFVIDYVARP